MGLPAEEERGGACLPWRQIACSWRGEGNERGRDQVPRRHARTEDCGRVLIGRDLSAASWHCGIVLIADSANPRHTPDPRIALMQRVLLAESCYHTATSRDVIPLESCCHTPRELLSYP